MQVMGEFYDALSLINNENNRNETTETINGWNESAILRSQVEAQLNARLFAERFAAIWAH